MSVVVRAAEVLWWLLGKVRGSITLGSHALVATIIWCCALYFNTICPATSMIDDSSYLSAMFLEFSWVPWVLLTLWPVCGSVRIATGSECHDTIFLFNRKLPRMKRYMKTFLVRCRTRLVCTDLRDVGVEWWGLGFEAVGFLQFEVLVMILSWR